MSGISLQHTQTKPVGVGAFKRPDAGEKKKRTCWTCGHPATMKYGHQYTSRGKYMCTNVAALNSEKTLGLSTTG